MAAKLLVYVTAAGASAGISRGGRIDAFERFAAGEDGVAAFRDYINRHPGRAAFVVVDATEEDYRFETLPHASGTDREQMVERKLRQYYRNTPFCMAQLVGRDTAKRRDDRFLFCALTNPEVVTPWLDALTAAGQPVGGVFLLPLVLRRLMPDIAPKVANLLAIDVLPSGIRLAFFRDGAFRLSRLSRADTSPETLARAISEEISNTRLYLHALRVATLDEPVSVVLLDHADRFGDFPQQFTTDIHGISCDVVSGRVIAAKLKLDPASVAAAPETAYLQLLAQRTPSSNLAKPDITLGYRRLRAKHNLYLACVTAGLAGLCWAGFNLSQQFALEGEREDVVRQTARVNSEYEAATRQFPSAPTTAENLRRTTEIAERLRATERSPLAFYAALSRALAPDPELAAVEVAWQYAASEISPGSGTGTPPAAAAGPAAPAPPPAAGPGGQRRQSGLLAGEIRNFRGDYRNAIERINRLAERLRQDPAVQSVRILQLPLNVSPGLSISGSASDAPAQSGSTDFKLVVVMKEQA
jgi:hypothetical protein